MNSTVIDMRRRRAVMAMARFVVAAVLAVGFGDRADWAKGQSGATTAPPPTTASTGASSSSTAPTIAPAAATLPSPAASTAPTAGQSPVVVAYAGSMAPACVEVRAPDGAIPSPGDPSATAADIATLRWDFGDPGSFQNASLIGFAAGHVYDSPGRYTITLKRTDASGAVLIYQGNVTIGDDGRRAMSVAPGGALPATIPANTEVLLARGGSYTAGQTRIGDNAVIAAIGEGAAPVLTATSGGQGPWLKATGANVVIQDLAINGANVSDVIGPWGNNLAVRGVASTGGNFFVSADSNVGGVYVGQCTTQDQKGYSVFAQGTNWEIVGNTFTHSVNEALVRSYVQWSNISDNKLLNPPTVKGTGPKNAITLGGGSQVTVARNTIGEGATATGNDSPYPSGGIWAGPLENDTAHTSLEWVIIEGNKLSHTGISCRTGLHHFLIAYNTIALDCTPAIYLNNIQSNRIVDDGLIEGNAVQDAGQWGSLAYVGLSTRVTFRGNTYKAPGLVLGKYNASNLEVHLLDMTQLTSEHNAWAKPTNGDNVAWTPGGYISTANWLKQHPTDVVGN
jgi:hypothetical protein